MIDWLDKTLKKLTKLSNDHPWFVFYVIIGILGIAHMMGYY